MITNLNLENTGVLLGFGTLILAIFLVLAVLAICRLIAMYRLLKVIGYEHPFFIIIPILNMYCLCQYVTDYLYPDDSDIYLFDKFRIPANIYKWSVLLFTIGSLVLACIPLASVIILILQCLFLAASYAEIAAYIRGTYISDETLGAILAQFIPIYDIIYFNRLRKEFLGEY